MKDFDPNGAATEDSGIFGLPFNRDESSIIIIPVPWEATCSYGGGCSDAPEHVIDASMFVELYDSNLGNFYTKGIYSEDIDTEIKSLSKKASKLAQPIIELAGEIEGNTKLEKDKKEIDSMCEQMNNFVFDHTSKVINQGKFVGLLGGDHSTAFGSIKAHLERYPNMGVLQIDAHADLRTSFENLDFSHASIMDKVISETTLQKLVQVGVRGYCEEEYEKIINSNDRISTFFDSQISDDLDQGISWNIQCKKIVDALPQEVYVSFDIDGLEQSCCPNTGTPVPGGLSYNQAISLIRSIVKSNRKIVGFDLVEVSTGNRGSESWDAICAANLLYKLCGYSIA